jgi:CubicO group peptidase (beta-lactamase class C family)
MTPRSTDFLERGGAGGPAASGSPPDADQAGRAHERGLSRRDFVARAAVAGAATIAPFSLLRQATARGSELDAFVRAKVRATGAPGATFAVVRGQQIVWSTGVGWANIERKIRARPDTQYMLASVSKTITCAGIMSLVEDGVLDLDANINRYLPFEVRIPSAPHVPITMRNLLTHTSAIRDRYNVWGTPASDPTLYFHGDSPIPLGRFMHSYYVPGAKRYRESNFYKRPPGKAYAYSNLAVALAGFVAESASGIDFDKLCRDRIAKPLGMTDSGFRLEDLSDRSNLAMPYHYNPHTGALRPFYQYGYPDYPDGAFRTSAEHLVTWLGAFMNFGKIRGKQVLSRSTVQEIRRNQIPHVVGWHQGLIWYGESPNGYFTMGHTGGDFGMTTRMFFRPDRRVGVVSLTNAYLGGDRWHAFTDVEERLLKEFA